MKKWCFKKMGKRNGDGHICFCQATGHPKWRYSSTSRLCCAGSRRRCFSGTQNNLEPPMAQCISAVVQRNFGHLQMPKMGHGGVPLHDWHASLGRLPWATGQWVVAARQAWNYAERPSQMPTGPRAQQEEFLLGWIFGQVEPLGKIKNEF